MKETAISDATVRHNSRVGPLSSTGVRSCRSMAAFSSRKNQRMMRALSSAPHSVTQNMPGLPSAKKKSMKSRPAALANRMDVVSPTSVAAPCRLEEMAMQMMAGTGEMCSFLHRASATGATISTVATLSTKAEITPANRDSTTTSHLTLWIWETRMSLIRWGILDSMNRNTVPMVPVIIRITFQSICPRASPTV